MAEPNQDKSRWYAVRAVPGSQRQARPIPIAANATDEEKAAAERRKGESIIERELRNEGIDVYMPSYSIQLKHHRTNQISERRLPLLVGYVFVHLPQLEFERVRKVESVMCMLAPSRIHGPVRFPESTISKIMLAEFEAKQQFLHQLHVDKMQRADALRGQLKKILPKGRARTIPLREYADVVIHHLSDGARKRVLGIIQELDSLTSGTLALIDKVA